MAVIPGSDQAETHPTLLDQVGDVPLLRLYETIIHRLPVGVIIAQQTGDCSSHSFRYVFANQAAAPSGLEPDIGTILGDRLQQLLATKLPALLARTLRTQTAQQLDALEVQQESGVFLFRGILLPLTSTMVAIILEDLTDKIRAERERESAFTALQRSNEDLEQFAYAASHDLQEPLRTVAGFAALLARRYRSRLDDEAHEYIDFIVDGCNRLKNLIDDLLAYSKLDRADDPVGPTSSDEALDDALARLRRAIDDSGAEVVRAHPLPSVSVPLSMLTLVFQNLLENALKFRSSAAPHITIDAQRDGAFWRFRVADNGIGIAREHYERIFRLFHRLHARSEYEGTGIGLAMCKKIVERYGGRVWIEPSERGGSAFFFILPALEG